jgi:4-amino-4-deoxy-L-arabinose transferase-like glycosyltransferase
MSAFFAAATVYVRYKVVFQIIGKKWVAWVSSALLAFSIYFWQMSVVAEVYTLHTFFLVMEIYLLLKWRETGTHRTLILFAFIYGLSLTNHTTGLLFAPGFAWLVFSSQKWKWKVSVWWLGMIGCFLAALLVYIYIPIRANSNTPLNYINEYYSVDPTTLTGLFWVVSGSAYRFFAFGYPPAEIFRELISGILLIWRNFLGVGFLLGILGLFVAFKRDWKTAAGWLLVLLGNFIFYINYRVLDKDTMFLPSLVVFTIFISFGLTFLNDFAGRQLKEMSQRKVIELYHPVFWMVLVGLTIFLNWKWADMSKDLGPETFSNAILDSVQANSTVIASWSPAVVLEYYQIVEGRRPDIRIYNQSRSEVAWYYKYWSMGLSPDKIMAAVNQHELVAIDQIYQANPVYSIEYDPVIANNYEYLPVGLYYRLEKKADN